MDRIYFKKIEDCSEFFEEVRQNTKEKTWKEVQELLKTNRSTLEKYRNRKYCLPENRFLILLGIIPDNKRNITLAKIEKKEENWGRSIAGKTTYQLHKDIFTKGREKAHKNLINGKYIFDVNMPLSDELCEFIGVFIGDGFTNVYNNHNYHTQITGDKELDSEYYYNILKPICKNIFNIEPKIAERKGNNGINFNIYSKKLFQMFTERFEMQKGVKCYTIKIPKEILDSEKKFLNSTLKGMFNSDGGIGIDKRASYKKPYVRINYTSVSDELIRQLTKILTNYNIKHSIHRKGNSQTIQINGEENIKRFLKEIGFSNKRHLDKIDRYL